MAQGLGGMGNLFKQAQEIQARLAQVQEELGRKTVEASSGGGMVQVAFAGRAYNLFASGGDDDGFFARIADFFKSIRG